MDYISILGQLTAPPGVTGFEGAAADVAAGLFEERGAKTWRDVNGSVFAKIGSGKPTVLIAAHLDEVALIVTDITEDGFLRIASVAGVDPRVLPGSRVLVDGREVLRGVVGAMPPHLIRDTSKNYTMDELYVDIGYGAEDAKRLVSVGDTVRYDALPPLALKNDRLAGKTMDDRAHIAVMLRVMELLEKREIACTVVFCSTVQEERGGIGALCAAYEIEPDIAIAIDVCHAVIPGSTQFDSFDIEKNVLMRGSNAHPKLFEMLRGAAGYMNIPIDIEANIGHSGTDAWEMQIAGNGAASAVLSTPLKYMHTSVELLSTKTLDNCAKLLAQFIADIGADWEEKLCLDE